MHSLMLPLRWSLLLLLVCVGAACSAPRESDEGEREPPNRRSAAIEDEPVALGLKAASDAVQTIQLYGAQEDALPILPLRGSQKLTLEFDLMDRAGRPLSVYFYHADRSWQRDLFASEYLTSFHRDDLFTYELSRGTLVDYAHYTYRFPNQSIGFRISGNYILRVTEQGDEDAVLFERPFLVNEDATSARLGIDNVLVAGQGFPSNQPVLTFTPPPSLAGNVFDYNVCFVQNGQLASARCADNPSLTQQPDLLFFLQPERAFHPAGADYFLDLGNLNVSLEIDRTDFTAQPYRVILKPDYARFPDNGAGPLLSGQSVVSGAVRGVGQADTEGEYVETTFRFVPDGEQPLGGDLYVVGSFNGWQVDLGRALEWVPEEGYYEGTLLIKQGQYEYRYTSPDPRVRRALRNPLPRPENTYAAFVYYSDASLSTDRLLAAQSVRAR